MNTQLKGKVAEGRVVSDSTKRKKTIAVEITRRQKHPIYTKVVTRTTKFHAHDDKEEAKVGDKVLIQETKPYSKTKSWVLVQVVEKAHESM